MHPKEVLHQKSRWDIDLTYLFLPPTEVLSEEIPIRGKENQIIITQGIETSNIPGGKKINRDPSSSGERNLVSLYSFSYVKNLWTEE